MNMEGVHPEILYCSFNQQYECFAVGTNTGFYVCDTTPVFRHRFRRDFDDGGIGIVEMLFRCNILALVGGGKQPKWPKNKVMIWDDHQEKCIAELEFRSDVRGVKLRRDRIVVVLESKIYVYNFSDLKLLQQIETSPNPGGLCALSPSAAQVILAVPATSPGHLQIDKSLSTSNQAIRPPLPLYIPACKTQIAQIGMDLTGAYVAVTSAKGTVIRVYDISKNGIFTQVGSELRRGSAQANVQCLAFNHDASLLAVTSDRGTIHIFVLDKKGGQGQGENKSSVLKNWVPTMIGGDYTKSEWSAANIDFPDTKAICAFVDTANTLVVLGASGNYYRYSIAFDAAQKKYIPSLDQKISFSFS